MALKTKMEGSAEGQVDPVGKQRTGSWDHSGAFFARERKIFFMKRVIRERGSF